MADPIVYENTVTGRRISVAEPQGDLEMSRRWRRVDGPAGAGKDGRPSGNASAQAWRDYAVAQGMDPAEAAEMSRDDLREMYPAEG